MAHQEEIYARQLYRELQKEFHGKVNPILKFLGLTKKIESASDITISIEGAGVHWHCVVSKGTRQCTISCFDISWMNTAQYKAELYTSFRSNQKFMATGRTFDWDKTIAAVKDWIENKTVEELYSKYPFVDEKKRQLLEIKTEITNAYSSLQDITQNEVVEGDFSTYKLWFRQGNRHCTVYYYGYEPDPRFAFSWDNAQIFETNSSDTRRLGCLINRWLVDNAMPSELKNEFPEVEFGILGDYYEIGKGFEGECMLSWDFMEKFYEDADSLDNRKQIIHLIKKMREKGYDRKLRAGQSLNTLILSRARKHGLKPNQKKLRFEFEYIKSAMEVYIDYNQKFIFDKVEYNDEIERMLKIMEAVDID